MTFFSSCVGSLSIHRSSILPSSSKTCSAIACRLISWGSSITKPCPSACLGRKSERQWLKPTLWQVLMAESISSQLMWYLSFELLISSSTELVGSTQLSRPQSALRNLAHEPRWVGSTPYPSQRWNSSKSVASRISTCSSPPVHRASHQRAMDAAARSVLRGAAAAMRSDGKCHVPASSSAASPASSIDLVASSSTIARRQASAGPSCAEM
mmetsp:Transcript_6350/g.19690  ORF Transcript_6350/g.19690 Transcript_6350/m.19690 type:complete len:211 (-) Transcript_6350:419-1051(-)